MRVGLESARNSLDNALHLIITLKNIFKWNQISGILNFSYSVFRTGDQLGDRL